MIWCIDKGNGVSTILGKLNEYMYSNDLYKKLATNYEDNFGLKETALNLDKSPFIDMDNIFNNFLAELRFVMPGLVAIHIESFLSDLDNKYFKKLMEYCVNNRHDNIYVFIIPFVDEGVLSRVKAVISSYLNVRTIKFPPYTDDELIEKVRRNLSDFNIELDDTSKKSFRRLLNKERSDGRFYGLQTINKLSTELVLLKANNYTKNITSDMNKLVEEDFQSMLDDNTNDKISGIEKLKNLEGLHDVKKRIEEIIASIKVQQSMYDSGAEEVRPCYHMMFTGNPGTGKTLVARIVGQIFYEEGLLPVGDILEVSRVDLVAEHIGQTGLKTVSVCNSAQGSVLFIDEAYMLAAGNGDRSGKDFGSEALGALIAEMENKRDKFIVIMAGYDEDMDELCKINPGLKQRVPHRIHFSSYNNDELFNIFCKQIETGCSYNEKFIARAKKFFMGLSKETIENKEFANARFVRNLVERIRIKALLRHTFDENKDYAKLELETIDFENAIADEDMKTLNTKQSSKIGFIN